MSANVENTGNSGTGTDGDGVRPGRVRRGEQPQPGRYPATARDKWSKETNLLVMKCYIKSEPEKRGYRKRMFNIWKESGGDQITEQRLADQVRQIQKKSWLSEAEIEKIKSECRTDIRETIEIENIDVTNEAIEIHEEQLNLERSDENNNNNPENSLNDESPEELNEDSIRTYNNILERLKSEKIDPPMNLRNLDRNKVRSKAKEINKVLMHIPSANITETNRIILAAANEVAESLGVFPKQKLKNKEPWWKRRIEDQIKQLRKDISHLEGLSKQKLKKKKDSIIEGLERKYHVKNKGTKVVIEELKQRVMAKAAKVKRYESRINQYRQNRMFQSNQKRLFEELDGNTRNDTIVPDAEESKEFWNGIWGKSTKHNTNAKWLQDMKEEYKNKPKQEDIKIDRKMLDNQIRKMPNWKAPGPDGLQGFWLKTFTSIRERMCHQLNECLEKREVPKWMTKGRTVLIMKDKEKGRDVKNFRPITCLPLMWKLLTAVMSEEMYKHLEKNKLLPNEQKGCRKRSRGTKDQLLIDKMIIRNCKRRAIGLGMAWIDYKKAFDMVPHSWLVECMEIFGVAHNMKHLILKSMENWKTELTSANQVLGEVNIKRGIFQGDSLSPLLFVLALIPLTILLNKKKDGYELGKNDIKINHLLFMDDLKLYGKNEKQLDSLIQTVNEFTDDIKMEFGISKCAVLIMKKGKISHSEGVRLPNQDEIKSLGEEDSYKYLGVLESDDIKNEEMKKNIRAEYFRRIRKILNSKLNGGNIITAINSRAVAVVRYSAGIVKWTKEEMRKMDTKTRKLMTINRALHPQADVDRLYVKRSRGGRGLIGVEDCIAVEIQSLIKYLEKSEEPMLKAVVREQVLKEQRPNAACDNIQRDKWEKYKNKELHGKFIRDTEEERDELTWEWLKKGVIKKETEGLIMAAQDQALRTNAIKKYIDKVDISPKCRMCGDRDETISHITTECSALAQKQYKNWRHDKVAQIIHWEFCGRVGVKRAEKWYDHEPEGVIETERYKILWDFKVQTDHQLDHNRPDLIFYDKEKQSCQIIDVACPFDTRVKNKMKEKIDKYQDLKREIKRIWKCKEVNIIPVVIGALGTIHRNMPVWMKKLDMYELIGKMQQACILGSARILRKVLDT